MEKIRKDVRRAFPFTWQDLTTTLVVLGIASALCAVLRTFSTTDSHVPLIFVLAVLIVSRLTNGYLFGLLSSIVAVFGVNYAFTYPYFQFNFTMTGYPLTFICTFAVSLITCTLTSKARESEKMRIRGEREKMRADLLRAISHDLRTPLTSINGSLNAVLENGSHLTDAEKKTLLTDAKSESVWLINMVENLLSITRIDKSPDGANLHKEPQAMEEVVSEAVSKFRRQYPDMEVSVSVPEELIMIPMDAMLIEQVIVNLLQNAAVHGKTVTAAKLTVTKSGGYAVFRVEDNGVGIDPDLLPTLLFEGKVYKDSREPSDGSTRSMGIGLSVCNAIVKAHGGSMKANNLPRSGACVSFTLPLA